jgi:asparagine synthase (glutamine-hydrolysing)
MCGIAGIIDSRRDARVDPGTIHQMCEAIVHRGPDDEGMYVDGGVGLGMRRLSIIDVAGGHQPVHNESRTVWVVFNGEIYNFPELRAGLETRGHRFYTNSDTEVIVHLYEEMGANCVQKLRGMFAIALYDERQRRLLLARDRLGKKPLHYALSNGRLIFGSEIKALLAAAPDLAEVDREALLHFFYFGYIPDPITAFRPIRKLPPGFLLEFSEGRIQLRKYWDLPDCAATETRSEEECLEELEHLLAEAVRIRLISDVPLGALLSGGVDSSTVVALMARFSSAPVKTFSIGFSQEDFNEAPYARAVAEKFNTEHHELIVKPNVADTLNTLTRLLEEPFGDSSMLPTYLVCQEARRYVTVALAGDGGDEFFAGYDRYEVQLRREKLAHVPETIGRVYRNGIYPLLPSGFLGRKLLFNLSLASSDRYLDSIAYLPAEARERSLFSKDFLDFADRAPSPFQHFRAYLAERPGLDPLSKIQFLDTRTYLPGDILTKVDRMSMATSLEVRAPLLDHVVVEWAARLSPRWKIRFGERKYILRRLARRLGVPGTVLDRPKQGFAMPLVHWWKRELKQDLLGILFEPRSVQRGYFDPAALRQLVSEHLAGRRDHSAQIWLLLIFELWHRNFLERMPSFSRVQGAETPVSVVS